MTKLNSTLLSICVPTYNRSEKLKGFLKALSIEILNIDDVVEIVISDNCSTDNTLETAHAFAQTNKVARVLQQETNIGAEGNFWKLWQNAIGEYVWIVGDDDLLDANALTKILAKLKSGPDIVILNYSSWDSDLKIEILARAYPEETSEFANMESVMKFFGPDLAFISMSILRASYLKDISAQKYADLSHTGLAFMYGLYSGFIQTRKILYLSFPAIKNRNAESVPYNWDKYFVLGMSEVFDQLRLEGYTRTAVQAAKKRVVRRYIFPTFKMRKISSRLLPGQVVTAVRTYFNILLVWVIVAPLVLIPSGLAYRLERSRKKNPKTE